MSGMAEVLHGLRVPRGGKADGFMFIDANAAHAIADALTAAGFGPAKEAAAVALEQAAQTIEGYAKDGADGDTSPYETATWLRARAAKIRANVA